MIVSGIFIYLSVSINQEVHTYLRENGGFFHFFSFFQESLFELIVKSIPKLRKELHRKFKRFLQTEAQTHTKSQNNQSGISERENPKGVEEESTGPEKVHLVWHFPCTQLAQILPQYPICSPKHQQE